MVLLLPVEINPQFVAPMRLIYQNWSVDQELKIDWYLDLVLFLKARKIVFSFVQLGSPLFDKINQSLKQRSMVPEYVVRWSDFLATENPGDYFNGNFNLTLLIDHWPEAFDLSQMAKWCKQNPNVQFLLVARNDWDFTTLYRSLPYWMRSRLFVDFPLSLHQSDPYFAQEEVFAQIEKLKKLFPDIPLRSYCPQLMLYSESHKAALSPLSLPKRLNPFQPKITLICFEKKGFEELLQSKEIQEKGEDFEIILIRFLSEDVYVIPKIKSLTVTTFWLDVEPINLSQGLLYNFCLSQVTSDWVFILNPITAKNWDQVWIKKIKPFLTAGQDSGDQGEISSNIQIISTDKDNNFALFFQPKWVCDGGGFDHLLCSPNALITDILKKEALKNPHSLGKEKELVMKQIPFQDRFLLKLTKVSQPIPEMIITSIGSPHSISALAKASTILGEIYFKVWNNRPLVIFESHWTMIKRPFLMLHQRYFWRLKPTSYSLFWKVKSQLNLSRIGWFLFKLGFPIRKVYYFLNYQYRKRILGLHQKVNSQ